MRHYKSVVCTLSVLVALLGLAEYGRESGKRHIISTQIEHKAIDTPFVFRTVYDRVP